MSDRSFKRELSVWNDEVFEQELENQARTLLREVATKEFDESELDELAEVLANGAINELGRFATDARYRRRNYGP